ncbi:MAG: hypothetical protein ACOX2P_01775 [Bacillota bacterium]
MRVFLRGGCKTIAVAKARMYCSAADKLARCYRRQSHECKQESYAGAMPQDPSSASPPQDDTRAWFRLLRMTRGMVLRLLRMTGEVAVPSRNDHICHPERERRVFRWRKVERDKYFLIRG